MLFHYSQNQKHMTKHCMIFSLLKKIKQAFSVFPFSVEDFFMQSWDNVTVTQHRATLQNLLQFVLVICKELFLVITVSIRLVHYSQQLQGLLQPQILTHPSETSVIILLYRRREWAIEMFSDMGGVGQFSDHQACSVASAQFLPKAGETCLSPWLERYGCNSFP